MGLIRRPASFVTSMTDERGDELMYSGVKISEVVDSGKGIGGVMALLWFQVRKLTIGQYCMYCKVYYTF